MTLAPYIHAIRRAPGRGCNLTAATEGIYLARKAHCLAAVADHSDPKRTPANLRAAHDRPSGAFVMAEHVCAAFAIYQEDVIGFALGRRSHTR